MRATSRATLPFPTTTARSPERSKSSVLEVGVAVVPGDERGRGPRAGQVLAGDAHAAGRSARRPRRRRRRRGARARAALTSRPTSTLPKKRKPGLRGDLLEDARDRLDLGMVGRDAEPDEAPRRRQPLDQVDLDRQVGAEQRAGGVEAGRARADDGDAQGAARSSRRRGGRLLVAQPSRSAGVARRPRRADLEAVAAAARAGGVRVVDLEPGLLRATRRSRPSRPSGSGALDGSTTTRTP